MANQNMPQCRETVVHDFFRWTQHFP